MNPTAAGHRSPETALDAPPLAEAAFRVGVVGHRPNRLQHARREVLQARIDMVLDAILKAKKEFLALKDVKSWYASHHVTLRAISPLAEGTDRMFAHAARHRGFELCAPLPFLRHEYATDFSDSNPSPTSGVESSRHEFTELLRHATVYEIDNPVIHVVSQSAATNPHGPATPGAESVSVQPTQRHPGTAYASAGRVVLNQSDLLVVVWDGEGANMTGGTYETLRDAVGYGLPIVWIDAHAPHAWTIIRAKSDLERLAGEGRHTPGEQRFVADDIKDLVLAALTPPAKPRHKDGEHGQQEPDLRVEFFRERKPARNWWFLWKLFRGLVAYGKPDLQPIAVPDFIDVVRPDWPVDSTEEPEAQRNPTAFKQTEWHANRILRPHFAWADKLADLYADKYRATYVLVYLLAALAVIEAMLPYAFNGFHWIGYFELGTLIGLLVFAIRSRRQHWHERWIQYRMLAEFVREIRALVPVGGGRPFPHTAPPHLEAYGSPDQTWMHWQKRAITRATGLPNVVVTQDYLRACLISLDNAAESQCKFHSSNAERSGLIYHHLHVTAAWLVGLTISAVFLHLLPENSTGETESENLLKCLCVPGFERWLLFVSATFPAIGAALAGIENQGEFHRIAKRSRAMEGALTEIRTRIEALGKAPAITLDQVSRIATDLTMLMTDEVSDWRVMFADRPQSAGA